MMRVVGRLPPARRRGVEPQPRACPDRGRTPISWIPGRCPTASPAGRTVSLEGARLRAGVLGLRAPSADGRPSASRSTGTCRGGPPPRSHLPGSGRSLRGCPPARTRRPSPPRPRPAELRASAHAPNPHLAGREAAARRRRHSPPGRLERPPRQAAHRNRKRGWFRPRAAILEAEAAAAAAALRRCGSPARAPLSAPCSGLDHGEPERGGGPRAATGRGECAPRACAGATAARLTRRNRPERGQGARGLGATGRPVPARGAARGAPARSFRARNPRSVTAGRRGSRRGGPAAGSGIRLAGHTVGVLRKSPL